MTHFSDQFRIRLISQLFKGISRVLQKLFKYFNGTTISEFIISAILVLFKNLDLNLNDSESAIGFFETSLQNLYKLRDISHYHNILLDYASALQCQDHLHYLVVCYLFPFCSR